MRPTLAMLLLYLAAAGCGDDSGARGDGRLGEDCASDDDCQKALSCDVHDENDEGKCVEEHVD